jgi:hypothetical protein
VLTIPTGSLLRDGHELGITTGGSGTDSVAGLMVTYTDGGATCGQTQVEGY